MSKYPRVGLNPGNGPDYDADKLQPRARVANDDTDDERNGAPKLRVVDDPVKHG